MTARPSTRAGALMAALAVAAAPAAAQSLLDRTPNLDGAWTGLPGFLYIDLADRIEPGGVAGGAPRSSPIYRLSLATGPYLLGFTAEPNEWPGHAAAAELSARARYLDQATGAPFDLAYGIAYDFGRGGGAAEIEAARRLGPLTALAAVTSDLDLAAGDWALAVGALAPLRPGGLGVSLAGDVGWAFFGADREIVWSAGVQAGLLETAATVSLHATNARGGTALGRRVPGDDVRIGVQLLVPFPVGRMLGWFAPRERAVEGVRQAPEGAADRVVRVPIEGYAFRPGRVVIAAGTTVEWVNRDRVVHTATALDAAWDSGAIPPGGTWRATFERPGRYPYRCGPHPYMIGMVEVR